MGSESKNKSGDSGGGATQGIPAAMKKLVQNLKEIVNCTDFTEQEIYEVLRECDMDPDRAVERLLAQDTFHEVKSKRERRKEKEALDSRSRGSNVGLSRGGKIGSEGNAVQSGPTYMRCNELGKATDKEEMGSICLAVSSSSTYYVVKSISSDSFSTDNGRQSLGTGDTISTSAQVSPAIQPSWIGVSKGHLSMADIVRMGRPQKSLQLSNETSHASEVANWNCHPKVLGVSATAESESSSSLHSENPSGQQQVFHDEWPVIEQPMDCNLSNSLNMSASSNANMHGTTISLLGNCESDARNVSQEDVVSENHNSDNMESASKSSRHVVTCNNGLASYSNYNLNNTVSSEHQQGTSTSDAVVNVSSTVSDFQQLSLRNSKQEVPSTKDDRAVVLPSHLEALVADCSHLSFGTYNRDINSASSATRSELDEKTAIIDGSSAPHLDARSSFQGGDKHRWFDNMRETADDKNFDFLTSPQQEPVKRISEETLGHEYSALSSFPDPSLQNSQWVTSPLPFKRSDFLGGTSSRDMHTKSNFIPGDSLASTANFFTDSGFLQSSLLLTQSQPARNSNAVSSINSPAITRTEVMKPSAFALPQRSALPQDLTVQSSQYLEQVDDMRGYRSLPQNHPSMTSIDSQLAFSGSTAYNQSLPDIPYLPQNRSNTFTNRLPSVRDSFGYRNLGSSSYNPGSFLHNESLGSVMPSSNIDKIFSSQYDGVRNFRPIHQQGSLSPWDYVAESRSLPHTDFRGQSNQAPSHSHYINSGFSDPYHSQSSLVAQLGRLNGSADLTSKQSYEIWQHSH
ncbi:hypothetical protein L6164_031203 [Bauhinia variegata]|uniref:Uncharacterized protein n=1 Tax=Bauhinia variegata TaxID=167791 RepID=A0ACB9LEQ4_BAUVA|nr:hypothetical protein L6164_031203 [Bauhinia variegata]